MAEGPSDQEDEAARPSLIPRSPFGRPTEARAPCEQARASARPAHPPQPVEVLSGTSSDQTAQGLCHKRGGRWGHTPLQSWPLTREWGRMC